MTAPSASHLSDAEGRLLLRVARASLETHFRTGDPGAREGLPRTFEGKLEEPRGVFVTLTSGGDLRGCVGYPQGRGPLATAVAELAVSAAIHDDRFAPVTAAEVPRLHIDISVLTPLAPLAPGAVEVGRHGLVARHRGRSGLLLPQVATEWGWDAPTFLAHTCRKAGLPEDAWREPGFQLFGFEAQVFEE